MIFAITTACDWLEIYGSHSSPCIVAWLYFNHWPHRLVLLVLTLHCALNVMWTKMYVETAKNVWVAAVHPSSHRIRTAAKRFPWLEPFHSIYRCGHESSLHKSERNSRLAFLVHCTFPALYDHSGITWKYLIRHSLCFHMMSLTHSLITTCYNLQQNVCIIMILVEVRTLINFHQCVVSWDKEFRCIFEFQRVLYNYKDIYRNWFSRD